MLDDLYDQHLISEPARDRYRLHDLIREYARALASTDDPDDNDAAIGRLLDYYSENAVRAGQHFGRGQGARDRPLHPGVHEQARNRDAHWLEIERANLQAAVEYAKLRGSDQHCIAIPAAIHGFLRTRGHWGQALTLHEVELTISRTIDDLACQARALTCVGTVQRLIGNYVGATAALDEALQISRDLGDLLGQGRVLQCLGVIQRLTVGYSTAATTLQEALLLYQRAGDPLGQADALNELGSAAASRRPCDGGYS